MLGNETTIISQELVNIIVNILPIVVIISIIMTFINTILRPKPPENIQYYEEYNNPYEEEISETISEWQCQYCTSINAPTIYKCHTCGAPKQKN